MAWLIFALGAVLCAGGGAAIGSGLSYMPVEWGWSQLIAGTTALSAGVVTLALAALLQRLGVVHRTLLDAVRLREASAAGGAAIGTPEPEPILVPAEIGPDAAPEAAALRDEAPPLTPRPVLADTRADAPDIAAPEPTGTPDAHAPDQASVPAEPPGEAVPEVSPVRRVEPQPRAKSAGWTSRLGARRVTQEREITPPVSPLDLEPLPWAVDALAPERPAPELAVEPQAEPEGIAASAARNGADLAPPASAQRPPGAGPDPRAAIPPTTGLDVPADPASPTIVGRYQAGGASYALFSDGTIEVETDTGMHRFDSMDDLKRFLEQQDVTNRPGWPS